MFGLDLAAETFNRHFGNKQPEDFEPHMNDTIDMELWDKDGFMSIKKSKRIQSEDKKMTYEADIIGDIKKLEAMVEDETGKRVTLISRKKNE